MKSSLTYQLAWEYPTNRLLQYLPLGKYSACNVTMFGVVLACLAATRNFSKAAVLRFFLGFFEAAVTSGFALMTSQWYTQKEQGTRVAIWSSCNGAASIGGGLLAYVLARFYGHRDSFPAYKVLFLSTGLLTVVIGVIFLWAVPDNQLNARWLSRSDQLLTIERIRINQQGIGNQRFKAYQFKEVFSDPVSWAFVLYALFAMVPSGKQSSQPPTSVSRLFHWYTVLARMGCC